MRFAKPLSFVFTAGLLFTACSKKPQTAAKPAETPAAVTAPAASTESEKDATPSVRFNLPGSSSSASGGTVAPTRAPASSSLPPSPPTVTSAGDDEGAQGPQIVEFYPPFYPLPLRMEGIEGRVMVRLDIDAKGNVSDVGVLGASAPQFNEYAVAAAKLWKFTPARKGGNPVAVSVQVPLDFVSEFGSGQMSMQSPLAGLTYVDGMYYTTSKEGRLTPANVQVRPLLSLNPTFDPEKAGGKDLRVVLAFTVNEQGQVVSPSVSESSGTEFDQVALKAIRFWQFIPQIRDGKPIPKKVSQPINLGVKAK